MTNLSSCYQYAGGHSFKPFDSHFPCTPTVVMFMYLILITPCVVSSHFPELLKVIRETENDDLTGVMQKLISTYGDQEQVASIAVDIARDLVRQFTVRNNVDSNNN